MNLTPAEHDRADAYIRRLEGAEKEVAAKQADAAAASTAEPPPPPPPETPTRGRIDALTIVGASLSVVALGVGVGMAIKAEADKPPANFVTGKNGTYDDLVNRTNQAHSEAVAADVCFGAAIVLAAATTYLYFGRPKNSASTSTGSTSVSASPWTGGGALFVQGSF